MKHRIQNIQNIQKKTPNLLLAALETSHPFALVGGALYKLPVFLRGVTEDLTLMQAKLEAAIEGSAAAPVVLPDSVPSRKDIEVAELRMAVATEMAELLRKAAGLMTPERIQASGQGTTLGTVRATIRSRADDLTGLRAEVAVKLAVARS